MPDNKTLAFGSPFGGQEQRQPSRKFLLQVKDFTTSEQGPPIRVLFGTERVAGVYFTPIWNFKAVPIKTKVGK